MNRCPSFIVPALAVLAGLAVSGLATPLPTSGPATRAGGDPAPATTRAAAAVTQPSKKDRERLQRLTRRAIEQFKTKKYDQVEKSLTEALAIDPDHSTNLYNMACVSALTGKTDTAIAFLERAAVAGFTDFIHIQRDPDLAPLRELPRFKELMGRKNEFQRKAADRVIAQLKETFGAGYIYEINEQDKLIFATNTDRATLDALKKTLLAQAHSQWAQLFEHRPDQYVSVVLPSAADYKKVVPWPGVGGFYNDSEHILISRQLGQVMTHEFTHALHAADLDPLGQEHPIWIIEGLATLFESATYRGEVLTPQDNFRLPYLQGAARNNKLIPLEKLLKMEQREFVSKATLAYGQSGSVLLWLYEQKLLRKFYEGVKAGFDKDPTGLAALEGVTGKKLAELEKDWRAWMVKRTPPPTHTGPNGAFLGVRFGQGNDGLRVDEVVPESAAAKAGVKIGDVVTALNDVDVRDYASFMPMLKQHQPGETVTLRVRRGAEYLDLRVLLARRPGAE